jgi:hypothetical protein
VELRGKKEEILKKMSGLESDFKTKAIEKVNQM